MKAVFTGDWHYGLTVEDLDRTPEVHKAVNAIVDFSIKEEVDFVSIGGDLTDTNYPQPQHLALLIEVLNRLEEAAISTFVSLGNHEAIADDRMWALTPLEKVGYHHVEFIKKPTLKTIGKLRLGFLPHVTRSTALAEGFKNPQEYLEAEAQKLITKNKKLTIVSHHNLSGARAGTEAMRLRQSDLQIPRFLLSEEDITIVNSHIHSPQEFKNVILPGSPICTDFGDVDDNKGFVFGTFNGSLWEFERIKTPQAPLQEFELEFFKGNVDKFWELVNKALDLVRAEAIVKLRVLIDEESVPQLDKERLKFEFSERSAFVKKVDAVIKRKKYVRDRSQKVGMSPQDAVKNFLDKMKPEGADRKLVLANQIIDGAITEATAEVEEVYESHEASDDLADRTLAQLPTLADIDLDALSEGI